MDLLKKKRGYEIGMFWWSPFFSKDSKTLKTSRELYPTSRELVTAEIKCVISQEQKRFKQNFFN